MSLEKIDHGVEEAGAIMGRIKKMARIIMAAGILTLGVGSYKFIAEGSESELQTPQKYVEYVENNYGKIDETKKQDLVQKLEYLSQKFSPYIVQHLFESDKLRADSKMKIPTKPKVQGFENLGLDNSRLKELWSEKYYPNKTIEGNIDKIELKSEIKKVSSGYKSERILAEQTHSFTNEVLFFADPSCKNNQESAKETVSSLDWTFSHALGHKNDFIQNNHLTTAERVEFLFEVTGAFEKPGSYRDILGNIESMHDPEKQKENFYKVREYWAEIAQYYLTFPESIGSRLSPKEIALIEKWLLKNDANFNAAKAKQAKDKFVENSFK